MIVTNYLARCNKLTVILWMENEYNSMITLNSTPTAEQGFGVCGKFRRRRSGWASPQTTGLHSSRPSLTYSSPSNTSAPASRNSPPFAASITPVLLYSRLLRTIRYFLFTGCESKNLNYS